MEKILTIEEIKQSVAKVAKEYDLKRVTLFGSYATGKRTKKSDIDLLVEFSQPRKKPVTLFTLIGFQQDIEDMTGKRVDVIRTAMLKDSFIEIDKEVLLYDAEGQGCS